MSRNCCSPRVTGRERPDYSSFSALLASPPFAGKSGEALALAIYDHFTGLVDGSYHSWTIDEAAAQPRLRRALFDPLKMLNAYGFMICGQCATMLYALYRRAGFAARQFGVPGHSLCEVFYEGRWHFFDVDMRTWFRAPEGHIASAYELAVNARSLIVDNPRRSQPCNLPDRTLPDYADMFASAETAEGELKGIWPHWAMRGHSMDFYLRPGQSMMRGQAHDGRFHMPQSWKQWTSRWPAELQQGVPRERNPPYRTIGNGSWTYAPNLSSRSRDFDFGVWEYGGVAQSEHGLECPAENAQPGRAVFRIHSPYPFCGRPDWSGEKIISRDGVWLEFAGRGVRAEICDAEGVWRPAGASGAVEDITALLDGRYDCLLRFTLDPGGRLERFKFHGFTMTAPMSLPRLVSGANPMRLGCLDEHHLQTEPWAEVIDFRAGADLPAQARIENGQAVNYAKGWRQVVPLDGKPVRMTARFTAPAGRKFAWIYALASVREAPPGDAGRQASLEWSSDGENWRPLASSAIPCTELQWDGSLDGEVVWDKPLLAVFLRATSQTAITSLEFYGHLEIPKLHDGVLRVIHRWTEDGPGGRKHCEQEAPPGQSAYEIACGTNPAEHSIEMRVESAAVSSRQ